MEKKTESEEYIGEGIDSWNSVILTYNAALKQMETKIEILNDEFMHVHQYNPIEYVKTRIKTPESIVKKLKRYGYETSIQNMVKYCNDIAGVRVVCSFTSDIYRLADIIGRQNDITVISVKDYMKKPKASGYKSYHMIVSLPVFLSDRQVDVKVEIQIRTIAMDFWASLEHQLKYKKQVDNETEIVEELRQCAETIAATDERMLKIRNQINGKDSGTLQPESDPIPLLEKFSLSTNG